MSTNPHVPPATQTLNPSAANPLKVRQPAQGTPQLGQIGARELKKQKKGGVLKRKKKGVQNIRSACAHSGLNGTWNDK